MLLAAAAAAVAPAALGQVPINSTPNAVGSGARALGMGGAFIAVADDATAASWNPGGLTQLERPEISLVYGWKWLSEDFRSSTHPELGGENEIDFDDINYFSIAYPFRRTLAGRNFVVSLNYQHKYDFDRALDIEFRDIAAITPAINFDVFQEVKYRQEGGLSALSPALGFEVTDRLAVGLVMNLWDQSIIPSNEWKIRTDFRLRFRFNGRNPSWISGERAQDYENFEGTNYTFGALWRPVEGWQVGAVYHTKFAADVDYTDYFVTRRGGFNWLLDHEERRIEFPSAWGVGVAYRFPNDKLTLSLDVTKRNWDEFVEVKGRNNRGDRISPITGLAKYESYHEATYTVRLGGEYVFIDPTRPRARFLPTLRAGAYYDPEPAGGRKDTWYGLGRVTGEPDDMFGLTLGGGLLVMDRVNFDAAYEYRWGDDARKDTFGFHGTRADVEQHHLYVSTIVYF